MGIFTSYFNNDFRGCRHIANARDTCRNRDVRIFAIPGHWDCVGVSDGTDKWIAPSSTGPFFQTATGDLTKLLKSLEAGEAIPIPSSVEPPKRIRKALIEDDPPDPLPSRRRPLLEQQEPQPRKRRALLI